MTSTMIDKTVKGILVLVVVALVLWALINYGIPSSIKNMFPSYRPDVDIPDSDFTLDCQNKIAVVEKGSISMCRDANCQTLSKTKLLLEDNIIYVDQVNDDAIGQLLRGRIVLFTEVVQGIGSQDRQIYFEVEKDLPSQIDLVNLQYSEFFTDKQLCKSQLLTLEQYRKENAAREIMIPVEYISTGKLYVNIDEFLQNVGKSRTRLYLDKDLRNVANSYYDEEGILNILAEEEQDIPRTTRQTYPVEVSISKLAPTLAEGQTSQIIPLPNKIDNSYNKLGLDTSSDPLTHAQFRRSNGKIYVRFLDYVGWNYESPWINVDYWDAYKTFARAPSWAILP